MYNIIPLILILVSLSVIIVIVVRKFSVLANLDVDNIPAEREARFKQRIISNRLKRNLLWYYSRISRNLRPLANMLKELSQNMVKKLSEMKEADDSPAGEGEGGDDIDKLFNQAEEHFRQEDLTAAENKYIRIISLDSRNIRAFRGLGRVYLEHKNYAEARQTLEHAIRLMEKDWAATLELAAPAESANPEDKDRKARLAATHHDLALVCREQDDNTCADLKYKVKKWATLFFERDKRKLEAKIRSLLY